MKLNRLLSKPGRPIIAALAAASLTSVSACSWVSPSVDSQYVALVKAQAVAGCQKIGETTSKTLSKIVVVGRSEEKQSNELIMLAKNQAAVMQGDTIVAKGPAMDGEQVFSVYNCSND
ncbi:MAG TPA: DUF4156 domain-containing protein [Marinagarivorans sp.]